MSFTKTHERGAAAVEFAMVALLLITLIMAIFEGGRLFVMYANLSSAARDAAREMAISGDQALALSRADEIFMFGTPAWDTAGSAACPSTGDVSDLNATVSLTVETGMVSGLWPNTYTLRGTGAMRCNG